MKSERIDVLLVEDNPDDVALIEAYLDNHSAYNYAVHHRDCLADSVRFLRENAVDVILLDLNLTDSMGEQTFHRLSECEITIPIIVVTGTDEEDLGLRLVRQGAQDFLMKNKIDGPNLVSAIRFGMERVRASMSSTIPATMFQSVIDAIPENIVVINTEGEVVAVNQGWRSFTESSGLTIPRSGIGSKYIDLCATNRRSDDLDITEIQAGIQRVIDGNLDLFEFEQTLAWDARRWLIGRATFFNDGIRRRIIITHEDITRHKHAEMNLRHQALHDSLTGLPNRMLFMERAENAARIMHTNPDYQFAFLFIDMDKFKIVNDEYGHDVGDRLLIDMANRLRDCIRPHDTVARLGGDEFAVLVNNMKSSIDGERVAERITVEMHRPFVIDDHPFKVTVSVGIKPVTDHKQHQVDDLLKEADQAMYKAKATGRGCFRSAE